MKTLSLLSLLGLAMALLAPIPRASAPPAIGPLLDQDLQISTGEVAYHGATIAFDGTHYLVVWSQLAQGGSQVDIYGRFVDPFGNFVGDAFCISDRPANQLDASVAFNGGNYLVVWHDNTGTLPYDTINARAVSPAGELLGDQDVVLSDATTNSRGGPALASNGAEFLVVWNENENFTERYGDIEGVLAEIQADGQVKRIMGDFGYHSLYHDWGPSVAFGQDHFLLTWSISPEPNSRETDLYGVIYSADAGTSWGEFPISTAPDYQYNIPPNNIAFDGQNFLVTWDDHRSGQLDIYAARVSETGQLLDGPPKTGAIPISTNAGLGGPHEPQVAYNGQWWLTAWAGPRVLGSRVTPEGILMDPQSVPLSRTAMSAFYPGIASDGTNYLVVWNNQENTATFGQLIGERIPFKFNALMNKVEKMMVAGRLAKEDGAHLVRILQGAQLAHAKDFDQGAILLLRQFCRLVQLYMRTGRISAADGNELITDAREIIALLGS